MSKEMRYLNIGNEFFEVVDAAARNTASVLTGQINEFVDDHNQDRAEVLVWNGSMSHSGDFDVLKELLTDYDCIKVQFDGGRIFYVDPTQAVWNFALSEATTSSGLTVESWELSLTDHDASASVPEGSTRIDLVITQLVWDGDAAENAVITPDANSSLGHIIKIIGVKNVANAELQDIRVGVDGTVYPTAGDAVRTQIESAMASGGTGVPTSVRSAILALFQAAAYAETGLEDEIAVIEAWAEEVTSITLSASTLSLSGNTPQTLTATTEPAGSTVVWSSSDTSVATVSDGVVTGVSNGSCAIIAAAGDKSANCAVTVTGFATLSSISAVYTQSGTVYDTDSLDDLKADLVVTANYDDSTTETVASTDYTLSGTLTVGTSTITVSYGGKTTTFTVAVSKGIDYNDNPLADVTWYDDYTYNNSGAMVAAVNEHCTSKFDAQTCIYALVNSDTSVNSYVSIFVWDENDVYLGGPGNNNTGRWMLKEGYKYAIKVYGANANKNAISLMPVDNRATAVPSFEINLSDYVESITVAGNVYELSVGTILAENGIESSNWNTAINNVNSLCRIDYGYINATQGIPFNDDFTFGFYTTSTMYMRAKSVGSGNLSGFKNYITQNSIKVKFNS